jgi:hypothetical protein
VKRVISQINSAAVPQNLPVQPPQSQDSNGTFESLMKKSVSKLNQKKDTAHSAAQKFKSDGKKDSDQKTDSNVVQASLAGTDLSSLSALLQQSISMAQPVIVGAQVTGDTQAQSAQTLNSLQAANAAQAGSGIQAENLIQGMNFTQTAGSSQQTAVRPSSVRNSGFFESTVQNAVGVPANSAPATPQNLQIPNTDQALSAAQQPNSVIAGSAQNQVQAAQNIPMSDIAQSKADTFQASQKNQSGNDTVITSAISQEKQSLTDSSSKLVLNAQSQEPTLAEKKADGQDTASQNQSTGSYSDLFRNGNVIIQVSDTPANVAKSACNQVADNVQANYKAGNSQFQIDLFPQNLGKVSVKLAVQDGVLTVEIAAANPKTQSMLMSSTNEIKSMLQTAVSQPVQVLQPSQDKAWYQQPQDQSAQQQERQQQNRESHPYLDEQDSGSTEDFLSVMDQLKQQSYAL